MKMECIKQNEIIDLILESYKKELGRNFELYKNHVYRVYNLAIPSIITEIEIDIISIASAFHDIGIWTNNTFDYLKPSIALAVKYSESINFNNETIIEIVTIINLHHKLTKIKTSKLAETFRQADLIDLTLGLVRKGRDRKYIRTIKQTFPNKGFHLYLLKLFFNNLLKNPLKPLPMYKL